MMAKKKSVRPRSNRSAGPAQQTLEQLKTLFKTPQQSDLLWCWKVGRLVEQWHPQAGDREHGSGVMKNLADTLQPNGSEDLPGRLQRMQRYAVWLDEHLAAQQLVRGQRKDGQPLTWSYVEVVLPLNDRGTRLRLLKKCIADNLTIDKLRSLVQEKQGGKNPRGGRRHTPPKSVDEALSKTATLTETFERWCQALEPDKDAQSEKDSVTIDRLPTSVRTKLRKARQALGELCQAIESELPQRQQPAKATTMAKPAAPKKTLRGFSGRSPIIGGR